MSTNFKKLVLLTFTVIIAMILIFSLMPKSEKISFEELEFTVPFIVKEIDEDGKNGITYGNKVVNRNISRDMISVAIEKSDISIDDFLKFKDEWLNKEEKRVFADVYSSYYGYELISNYADSGPEKYILYIHIFSSDNFYRIVTYGLDSSELWKLIESITINNWL